MFPLSKRVFPTLYASRTFSYTGLTRNNPTPPPPPPAAHLTDGEKTIHQKLMEKFNPSNLQVEDVSGGCGTFYAIVIASDKFQGLPMVKQHKLVTDTLKTEIAGIHGLQIKTIAQ